MENNCITYKTYVEILKRELVVAMGCTEPIAVAFCAAKARELLGTMPKRVYIQASGNIIKNVKSVIVPHTNGLRGLEAAAAVGIFYGDAERDLEVISEVDGEQARSVASRMSEMEISVAPLSSAHVLDLVVTVSAGEDSVSVHIEDEHTNVVEIIENGKCTYMDSKYRADVNEGCGVDYELLKISDIVDFANVVDISDVEDVISRQIRYNTAISKQGLDVDYGARIGKVLLKRGDDIRIRACAAAAAGSDARMGGCDMPVVICSGSGNQGLTASLPVIEYAKYHEKTEEELYRALVVSNLVTLHLKHGIGRLSAYCGAVSAGAGAGAGIAYLLDGSLDAINHTIVNSLAISSGIICDGAKASCAAKIVMSVDAGIMGYEMYCEGCEFYAGDGLVSRGVEKTIDNISVLGNEGMKETDKKIIELMTGSC
ncbi:MAG: serine dehydratase subunit alpha family protein [Ruminococcaceae bacterium]|nr:serine dehydratase subunit alpha family protein [Oscillospiraceae bacterium]